MAIKAVLVDGVANALGEVGLEFDRGHRQTVEEQHQVDAVFAMLGVMHLAHHAQAVRGVPGQNVGVDGQRRFELGQGHFFFEAQQFDAMPHHVERAALVELTAAGGNRSVTSLGPVVLDSGCPMLWAGWLAPMPAHQRGTEPSLRSYLRHHLLRKPAVAGQMLADFDFEVDFFVQAHIASRLPNALGRYRSRARLFSSVCLTCFSSEYCSINGLNFDFP
jgi:hypothetical protein